MLTTIFVNRTAVVLACTCWIFLVGAGEVGDVQQNSQGSSKPALVKSLIFALAVLIGTLEKLSGVGNTICMERQWVPVLARQTTVSDGKSASIDYDLTHLNAVMRRIDLICKLIAPIIISAIIAFTKSTKIGVLVVAGTNILSWPADYVCARRVWASIPRLRRPRPTVVFTDETSGPEEPENTPRVSPSLRRRAYSTFNRQLDSLRFYLSTPVWTPSLALALLHFSVLSNGATFTTYLLNTGFSLTLITVVRALSSVVEISATLVTPWAVSVLTSRTTTTPIITDDGNEQSQTLLSPSTPTTTTAPSTPIPSLTRLSLWSLNTQLALLVPAILAILHMPHSPTTPPPLLPSILLFTALSLSRLPLWTYDLAATELAQRLVVPASRQAEFAGVEQTFIAWAEMAQWIAAGAVWSAPADFGTLAVLSGGAVGVAAVAVAGWVRYTRGHLVHLERLKLRERAERCAGWGRKS